MLMANRIVPRPLVVDGVENLETEEEIQILEARLKTLRSEVDRSNRATVPYPGRSLPSIKSEPRAAQQLRKLRAIKPPAEVVDLTTLD